MANEKKTASAAAAPAQGARPNEHLARVGSVANAPWFQLEPGNTCHGHLENVYERPDERSKSGKSKFFQIRLLSPCRARLGRAKDAKVVDVPAGQVVNLNYGPKTKELEKFIPDIISGAVYEVSCYVEGTKFDIGKGQSMWPIDVRAGMVKAPRAMEDDPDFDDGDESDTTTTPAASAAS